MMLLLTLSPRVMQAAPITSANTENALATYLVTYRELPDLIRTEGVVEAVRQSTLAAQTVGQIVERSVKAGDRVAAGDVMVRIDPRSANENAAASLSQLSGAQAGLNNAVRTFERSRQLYAQKFISKAALDQVELDLKAARANVAALQAGAAQASTSKTFTNIAAPYAGIVASVAIEVGDMATPGRPLITLFDPAIMRVVATLSESQLREVKVNLPAQVDVPGSAVALRVKKITVLPIADSRSHTAQLRLDLVDATGLMPGQFVRAEFGTGLVRKLVIPEICILRRSEVTAVYLVMPDGQVQLRQIRVGEAVLGADGVHYVEVLAGVFAGERIALDPIGAGLAGAGQSDTVRARGK